MLATVLQGLVPGVPYRAEVAAATGAGVGARSAPIPIRIGESLVAAAAPMGGGGGWQGSPRVLGMAPRHPRRCVPPPFPMSLAAPPAERDAGLAGGSSMAERLAEVARQPAFIAGVGGACWVILAAFAAWLYGRRRRKKELSHFAGTGAATPGKTPPRHPSPHQPPTASFFTASFAYTPTGKPIGAAGSRHGPSPPSLPPLSAVTFPAPVRGSPR